MRGVWLILSVLLIVRVVSVSADILCYACNSYMRQCQPDLLANDVRNIFKSRCSGKCFIRQGEDNATYRGCFDGFASVIDLTDNYIGCRKQNWNNKERQWCLCDTDLCNVQLDNSNNHPEQQRHSQHPLRRPSITSLPYRQHSGDLSPQELPVGHVTVQKNEMARNEFFESFADKTKSERNPSKEFSRDVTSRDVDREPEVEEFDGHPPSLAMRQSATLDGAPEVQNRENFTAYEGPKPLQHFEKQSNGDVSEEPIGLIDFRVKGYKEEEEGEEEEKVGVTSHKQGERSEKGKHPSRVKLGAAAIQSLDYPFNQESRPQMAPMPKRVAMETVLDMRELGQRSNPAAEVTKEIVKRPNRPKALDAENAEEFGEEGVDGVAMESEDYPYNQILDQGMTREDLELMTRPRLIELHFSPVREMPPHIEHIGGSQRLAPPGELSGTSKKQEKSIHRNEIGNQRLSVSTGIENSNEPPSPSSLGQDSADEKISADDEKLKTTHEGEDILWVGSQREASNDGRISKKTTVDIDRMQITLETEAKTEESRTGNRKNEVNEERNRGSSNLLTKSAEVAGIRCLRTGYDANPTDCSQFIACLLDPRSRDYIQHLMRCPDGLLWDNAHKLCMDTSSTCHHDNGSHSNGV